MTTFVALLRGINVGGTGKLPMKDLAALCSKLGFADVRTYIQSGNVIFHCGANAEEVRSRIEEALAKKMGKPIDVLVRTASDLRATLDLNPFPNETPAKVAVVFLASTPRPSVLDELTGVDGEKVQLGRRELYIYYPDGMGQSKLKLPKSLGATTVRNVNTVTKLVEMCGK